MTSLVIRIGVGGTVLHIGICGDANGKRCAVGRAWGDRDGAATLPVERIFQVHLHVSPTKGNGDSGQRFYLLPMAYEDYAISLCGAHETANRYGLPRLELGVRLRGLDVDDHFLF